MLQTVDRTAPVPGSVSGQAAYGLDKVIRNRVAVPELKTSAVQAFITKMQSARLPELMIDLFCHYYEQLVAGATGFIPNTEALPVVELPTLAQLPATLNAQGAQLLDRVVVIKLNGGLGTSMGM